MIIMTQVSTSASVCLVGLHLLADKEKPHNFTSLVLINVYTFRFLQTGYVL